MHKQKYDIECYKCHGIFGIVLTPQKDLKNYPRIWCPYCGSRLTLIKLIPKEGD